MQEGRDSVVEQISKEVEQPELGDDTRVTVEESFFHCGKAFIRSKLWKAESWPEDFKANIGKQIAARAKAGDELADAIDKGMHENYETELY